MKKIGALFLCVCMLLTALSVCEAEARAESFTFTNSINIRMSITLAYVDADSGVLTTKGWWHVPPGGETVITVNADLSRGVYYAAYNSIPYFDSSTRENPQIRRWANPRTFTYTTDAQPRDEGVWLGTFYRINGRTVHIDTDATLRGQASQNTARSEPVVPANTTRQSADRETLAARLPREYLSSATLAATSKEDLAYLRNRIYANHGYVFRTKQWSDVFSRYDWYRPNPNFSDSLFNEYERENLRRIMAEERR